MADLHSGQRKAIGLNTDDKVRMLRLAWDLAPADGDTLLNTIVAQLALAQLDMDDDMNSSSANGHSASTNMPSFNTPTDTETVRGWNDLRTRFLLTRQFLNQCAKYGLDAFQIFCQGCFPNPLPAVVAPAVTLDITGKWAFKTDFNLIDSNLVIGKAVGDEAIYVWMLDKLVPATISRGDYSMGIVGRGGWQTA